MKIVRSFAAAALAAFAIGAVHAQGAATTPQIQYTLSIQGLGEFRVLSFSWGASSPVSFGGGGGGGGTVGRVSISSLHVLKNFDEFSGPLFEALSQGNHFAQMTLVGRRSGAPAPFLEMIMEPVFVSSQQFSASEGSIPVEAISFDFQSISVNGFAYSPIVTSSATQMREMVARLIRDASFVQPSK